MVKGLLGEHLGHSYSKIIHETLMDYQYDLMEMNREQLDQFLKEKKFDAVNVTIPYKQTVMPYLDVIDEKAKRIGAVNTIVNEAGQLKGYNTDYYGFLKMLHLNGIEIAGRKVLVLGDGGAAKAVVCALQDEKVKEIIKVKSRISSSTITYPECYANHTDAQVIINTSPVGMYPQVNACPIDLSYFEQLESVVDIIYNPIRTRLIVEAKTRGLKTACGMMMLVGQAIEAIEHFTKTKLDETWIQQMNDQLIQQKQNLVIIGMPGSGKTTISDKLAKESGRPKIEMDDCIIEKIQMPIKDFFALWGEEKFREIETEVAKEIAKETQMIISCGGGVIKNEENMKALAMNGIIVFIDRDVNQLAVTDSRPLSPDRQRVKALYQQRIDLYRKYSDVIIENKGSLKKAVAACKKLIEDKQIR